jgi:hypothetical protein
MAMQSSGSIFGIGGGEWMPPRIGRLEQRQLKWLHGVSGLIQQEDCQQPAKFSCIGEVLEAATLTGSIVFESQLKRMATS